MSILERVRGSGKCPPSLLCHDGNEDFEATAVKVVDANGTSVVRNEDHCAKENIFSPFVVRLVLTLDVSFLFAFITELCLSSEPAVPDDFKKLLEVR